MFYIRLHVAESKLNLDNNLNSQFYCLVETCRHKCYANRSTEKREHVLCRPHFNAVVIPVEEG